MFSELNHTIISSKGRVGCIVPSGIATDDTTKLFFQRLVRDSSLISLYDFENREGIFSGVHRSYKFCLLTFSRGKQQNIKSSSFVFFALQIEHIKDFDRYFQLTPDEIKLLNPNTLNCPTFRCRRDAVINKYVYQNCPIFLHEKDSSVSPYRPKVWRLLNTTDDSKYFLKLSDIEEKDKADSIAVIEAKMIHQFDHRYASFSRNFKGSIDISDVAIESKGNPSFFSNSRYYVSLEYFLEKLSQEFRNKKWFLTARNIARSTDERTVIASIIPRTASCEVTPYIEISGNAQESAFLVGILNSFILDYIARQKVGGTHLSYFIIYQLPLIHPSGIKNFSLNFFLVVMHGNGDLIR